MFKHMILLYQHGLAESRRCEVWNHGGSVSVFLCKQQSHGAAVRATGMKTVKAPTTRMCVNVEE